MGHRPHSGASCHCRTGYKTGTECDPGQRTLFQLAHQRSKSGSHTLENKAAILALSIYAGHWRFEQFTGQVGTKKNQPEPAITRHITLGGRQDLRLHFIVSAGIKVISDSGVSFAAGEFKELLDALSEGSGFSFADLAADRAGTHFAKRAAACFYLGPVPEKYAMKNLISISAYCLTHEFRKNNGWPYRKNWNRFPHY
jgi:hypothetical protein